MKNKFREWFSSPFALSVCRKTNVFKGTGNSNLFLIKLFSNRPIFRYICHSFSNSGPFNFAKASMDTAGRTILVLLLAMGSSPMFAMEKQMSLLGTFSSLIRFCFVSEESSVIRLIRSDKDAFEQKLLMPKVAYKKYPDQVAIAWPYVPANRYFEQWYFELLLSPFREKISNDPIMFLYYCYYQKHHIDRELDLLEFVVFSTDLLNKCLHICIDGYSALGAAIIAPDISDDSKRDFIQQLIDFGFAFNQKDKVLAELALYNSISADHKKTMILLLCDDQTSDFSGLPYDVKKSVIYWILRSYYDVSLVSFFK